LENDGISEWHSSFLNLAPSLRECSKRFERTARSIAITPKVLPSIIEAPECSGGWWRNVEVATKANGFHQGNNSCLLHLTSGSIESQKNGSRLRCDLGEPMAFVMAIGNGVFGECVEEIEVSVEVKNEDGWLCCGRTYLKFIWA
jgi:hypothetical protein